MNIRTIALGAGSLMVAALLTAGGGAAFPATAIEPGACGSINTATSPELDTVESRTTPVPHCFLHGTLGDDRDFRILLPVDWNGKYVFGLAGGLGGSENVLVSEGDARFLPAGYAYAESNQGRRGTVFEADDTFIELNLVANLQTTQYALQKVEELYGAPARRKYLHGFSGGARRGLALLEQYPGLYDGANLGSPPAEQSRWTHSVFDRFYPVILPKVNQIVAARDRNEDPMVTAGLSAAEKDALQQLYDAGVARGTEYNLFGQDGPKSHTAQERLRPSRPRALVFNSTR
jgi:predicted esterase